MLSDRWKLSRRSGAHLRFATTVGHLHAVRLARCIRVAAARLQCSSVSAPAGIVDQTQKHVSTVNGSLRNAAELAHNAGTHRQSARRTHSHELLEDRRSAASRYNASTHLFEHALVDGAQQRGRHTAPLWGRNELHALRFGWQLTVGKTPKTRVTAANNISNGPAESLKLL
jgi:hypothetical protein